MFREKSDTFQRKKAITRVHKDVTSRFNRTINYKCVFKSKQRHDTETWKMFSVFHFIYVFRNGTLMFQDFFLSCRWSQASFSLHIMMFIFFSAGWIRSQINKWASRICGETLRESWSHFFGLKNALFQLNWPRWSLRDKKVNLIR